MTLTLEEQCEAIWAATQQAEQDDARKRLQPPLTRIWDGDWHLQHVLRSENSGSYKWISNDTGPGTTEIAMDDPCAQWIYQVKQRVDAGEKINVHITVDKDGARWGGRMKDAEVEKKDDGTIVLTVTWMNDVEDLKHYLCWSNPFLPAAVQFPRDCILAGPSIWCLKTMLWLQLFRQHNPLITLPDDPLDFGSWADEVMGGWNVVVKPTSFLEDMANGTIWSTPSSRFKYWFDMAQPILQDAELAIVTRRFIATDDEQPIPGQTLRNGCLVVDIVDKSGYYTGTSLGGNMFAGLERTVALFTEDFIDTTSEAITDPTVPDSYLRSDWLVTDKSMPYVVYQAEQLKTSKYTYTPSTAVQIVTGGHSMPGVNELISAAIQAVGDILGNLAQVGSIGGSVDTILKPFYTDTILAWMAVMSTSRAQNSGWSRYFESFQDGSDRAYTLNSLMVLRQGFYVTRAFFSHQLEVVDGAPYLIGDQGQGHFFLDDRIGAVVPGDPTKTIFVDRVTELTLQYDPTKPPQWTPTIGDPLAAKDPVTRGLELISGLTSAVHDLGVI